MNAVAGPAPDGGVLLPELISPVRRIGGHTVDFGHRIIVMAVVNRTPDSFYDKGSTFALDRAVEAAVRAADAGADWVDIGGVAFAKGTAVPVEEELARVIPVVEAVAAARRVVISVDTFRAEVARSAIAAGASVVNDVSGLADPDMAAVVAASEATLVLTHSRAVPGTPVPSPRYADVTAEVVRVLEGLVARAIAEGVPAERLVIDPGHDLHKHTRDTLELTRRLREVAAIGLPVLAAVSNKDFIGEALGRPREARLAGSLAAAVFCAMQGARILRMHDVPQAVDAARMLEAILGWRDPVEEQHNR